MGRLPIETPTYIACARESSVPEPFFDDSFPGDAATTAASVQKSVHLFMHFHALGHIFPSIRHVFLYPL